AALGRIQGIVSKLSELAQGAEYATREYLPGTQMTDLRAQRARSVERHPTGEPHDLVLVKIRILVVDDDLRVCQSLRDLLSQEGCSVVVATGRRESLKRLEASKV